MKYRITTAVFAAAVAAVALTSSRPGVAAAGMQPPQPSDSPSPMATVSGRVAPSPTGLSTNTPMP